MDFKRFGERNRPSPGHDPMWDWLIDLFPINRSLTGSGVRETLDFLGGLIPGLVRHRMRSGTNVFDWTVPDEWTLRSARLVHVPSARIIAASAQHTLRVVGYSTPVDAVLSLERLAPHLHSIPGRPDTLPYVTSYYRRTWGFCLTEREREALDDGPYHAVIDATLAPGHLDFADLVVKGESADEVLMSTYVCHPSMANNELSGPVVATALARRILERPRRLTYRFVFVPETIGAVTYIHERLNLLKSHVVAGFVLTCCGDERGYALMPSRLGNSGIDRLARDIIAKHSGGRFEDASFMTRGSDERQYCSPGVDLPLVSMMRSRYGQYPEYHTSDDNPLFVTQRGLEETVDMHWNAIERLEAGEGTAKHSSDHVARTGPTWRMNFPCEPMLGKRGLHGPSTRDGVSMTGHDLINVAAFCDGFHDVTALAKHMMRPERDVLAIINTLVSAGIVSECQ